LIDSVRTHLFAGEKLQHLSGVVLIIIILTLLSLNRRFYISRRTVVPKGEYICLEAVKDFFFCLRGTFNYFIDRLDVYYLG